MGAIKRLTEKNEGCGSPAPGNYCVYILFCQRDAALYIAVTGDLQQRISQHRNRARTGFGVRTKAQRLVYYEYVDGEDAADQRVELLKSWAPSWTNKLIEDHNPDWADLAVDVLAP